MTHVTQAGVDGGDHAFGRQGGVGDRPLPPVQDDHHPQERNRIQHKGGPGPRPGHDGAAQGRTYGPGQVKPGAVQGNGLGQLPARHQFGNDRLPGGRIHGRAQTQQKGETQQHPGRGGPQEGQGGQERRRHHHPGLGSQQETAPVDDVGQSPGRQR